jgi:predicted MFS family arabinose efflux permease
LFRAVRQTAPARQGSGLFAPFRVRSFRFQWPADLLASWAFEMETLILGWFVLTETGSVVWLTAFGALQFLGTLLAPLIGVMADRLGHRPVLCAMRAFYAVLAALIAALALTGLLGPVQVLVLAVIGGLVRPSDIGMRNALIAATMPPALLMAAVGTGRTTADVARIVGALTGAGLAAWLGLAQAYVAITAVYAAAFLLSLGTGPTPRAASAGAASPWRDLRDGFVQVRRTPALLAAVSLAFLVNLCAFPLSGGLLPYVAKEVYGTDRTGLGLLSASFAAGALIGSLVVGAASTRMIPGRAMILAAAAWYLLLLVFARTEQAALGMVLLALAGFVQSLSLSPLVVLMLRTAGEAYRGRVMGARMLAIYGLPIGLFAAGPLIEQLGFGPTATLYAGFGLLCTAAIGLHWRRALWPRNARANAPPHG